MSVAEQGAEKFHARKVTRPRAQIEQQLKEGILHGKLAQGAKLPPETELAQQFGVSRPTVRDALGDLVRAGLIRKVPGVTGGNFVNSVTPDSLSEMLTESMDAILRLGSLNVGDLTEVRRFVEIPAAEWAARNRTDDHVEQLRDIVELRRATTIDDPRIAAYDRAFQTAIGQASGNRLLAAFIVAVHDATPPALYREATPAVGHKTVAQHVAIVAAIEAGDPVGAANAMERHLDYVLLYSANDVRTENS